MSPGAKHGCVCLFLCRYRHEFKSQELWEEIKFVLDNFAVHFTELFKVSLDELSTITFVCEI